METIEIIKASPVYRQILADSFGGVIYNVANIDKYDSAGIEGRLFGEPYKDIE